ncbi:hypothetical protein [Rhodopila globiformis]|uniref:Uncharacterized protein n=1 Tax=Rhodopila globiformis TaxID=1071 RepID=A0A2S6N6W8_RHOGL|nr:hypothetical protein [Rhodopila globiformis]PPQ30347.1 hypothetical protein CCS01_19515 [Rhodopila globiformis]
MRRLAPWLAPGLCAAIAAGGYVQVLLSRSFWCGRVEAYPGSVLLTALCLGQAALYLAAAASDGWAWIYRITQFLVLPILLYALVQVLAPYPHTLLLAAAASAVPALLALAHPAWRWARPDLPAISGLFLVSCLGFLAAFGQIPLTLPRVVASDWLIALAALAAAAVAVTVIASWRPRLPGDARRWPDIAAYLPLGLLLFPVLRARLPDLAYDSVMYKTTLPYQIAEWRTGDSAIPDGFLVGTNLQELLNGLLVTITGDYMPALISTLSYVLLLLITPLAFPVVRQAPPARRIVVAFAGLAAFVLPEAANIQGTSYQEALLLLLLVASLIRCPAWPGFLAMAVAVKINAAFIAPLVVLYHVFGYRGFFTSPRRLVAGVLAAAIVLAPQLNRNVLYTGRILGLSETLAAVTDPPGPNRILAPGKTVYDTTARGGVLSNALLSACNMIALDQVCPVTYRGDVSLGFHVFPASRAPLLALVLAGAVLAGAWSNRRLRWRGIASVAVFLGCYVGFLGFLTVGRYFLPLSLGFAILLLLAPEPAEAAVARLRLSWPGRLLGIGLGCWLIGSDLVTGTFTNVGWICRRDLTAAVQARDLRQPETPVQRFLADRVAAYKRSCPPPGLPPVILSEHDKLNSPYLGTQRIFHVYTQVMIGRFFAANPARQARAAHAIIAVVSQNPAYPASVLGPALADYVPCFHDGTLAVLCSTVLAPAGGQCATSLYEAR